jgi:N-acetyltransferase 10
MVNITRFAINDATMDWGAAEAQMAIGRGVGKTTVVSIKGSAGAGQKRKADEIHKKPTRRGKKHRP